MSTPYEVLEQLLSTAQAQTLDAAGKDAWQNAASALESISGESPSVAELAPRLAMPDELVDDFADDHLVLPIELSTSQDQSATAYLVLPTPIAALFFDSTADDPADQEQQTVVMASTMAGQVLQTINATTFANSPSAIVFSLDDIVANTMPDVLGAMDEPCLALNFTLQTGRILPVALILPGTFLDIVAGSYVAAGSAESGDADGLGFTLTEDELNQAELIEDPRHEEQAPADAPEQGEPEPAAVGQPAAPAPEERDPTPIGAAPTAQRAQFGPLPEAPAPQSRSNIDLLADLQMEVSVELGRTTMAVADVLALGAGSIVELDRLAGEPVDILVNDRVVARGEVVVVDENFGVRIVEVLPRPRDVGRAS